MFTKVNIPSSLVDAVKSITEKKEMEKEELKGNQHKIDMNKNNKIDAHDFAILRSKKKGVKEEIDPEKTTTDTLKGREEKSPNPFLTKKVLFAPGNFKEEVELKEDHFKVGDKVKCKESGMTGEVVKLDEPSGEDDEEYYTVKREDGKTMKYAPNELSLVKEEKSNGASKKKETQFHKKLDTLVHSTFGKRKDEMKKEEVEQIDELKKSTLGSYVKKAAKDARINSMIGKDFEHKAKTSRKPGMKDAASTLSTQYKSKAWKRQDNVNKAVDRLTKEEINLDEESLTAGKRLISKHGEGTHTAKVYKDTDYDEYQVHHYKDGKHMGEGPVSYHDDKDDAQSTAEISLRQRLKEEMELNERSYSAKAARSGKDIGKPGKMFSKIASSAAKRYGSKESGEKVAGAVLAKLRMKEDVDMDIDDADVEEILNIVEKTLTEPEMKKREDVVKSMKKGFSGFRKRYGDKAKSVMYATATKIAKEKA
jgi:hypothetical protein